MRWLKPKLLFSVLVFVSLQACVGDDPDASSEDTKSSQPGGFDVADNSDRSDVADVRDSTADETSITGPRLSAESQLKLSNTRVSQENWKALKLKNTGTEIINLRDVKLQGDDAFELSFPEPDEWPVEPGSDLDEMTRTVLEPEQEVIIRVWFRPEAEGRKEATIYVFSNDPQNDPLKVELKGTAYKPCLELSLDDYIHFDSNPAVGETVSESVSVTNCSTVDVSMSKPQITGEYPDVFDIPESSLPDLSDENKVTISSGEKLTFKIDYTPTDDDRVDRADLKIKIVGPWEETQKKPILSQLCVVPKASVKVDTSESGNQLKSQIEVSPPITVQLNGENSINPAAGSPDYKWEIIEKPSDSTPEFEESRTQKNTTLRVARIGTYKVKLSVENGVGDCSISSIVTINATRDGITVELTWDTPADPDETNDCGNDLDLHYLHPNGAWKHPKWDVYYDNKSPNWGDPDVDSDNPRLNADADDGAGPEILQHSIPKNGLTYRVGVYYYRAESPDGRLNGDPPECPNNEPDHYGASYATIRIFIDGNLQFEKTDKYMADTGFFWTVAAIKWPGDDITPINETSQGYPGGSSQCGYCNENSGTCSCPGSMDCRDYPLPTVKKLCVGCANPGQEGDCPDGTRCTDNGTAQICSPFE